MSKFSKKAVLFILLPVFVSLAVFGYFKILPLKNAQAGSGQNVSGFAWSKNVGWISFNNLSGGGSNNYGVNITDSGTTGIFSGYAWSNSAGWLTFNESDLTGCPVSPCRAWVDKATGQVNGWAKFLLTGDWIRLRGSGCNVSVSKATGDFSGWAWAGETGGWVSFNCSQTETGNICPLANYKVATSFDMNIKPTVAVGPAPNPASVNLCSTPAYSFSWIFSDMDSGDTQSQYQLQVDKEGTFSSFGPGEVDITASKSAQSGELQTKDVLLARNPGIGQLDYNSTNYKWRVRVWDNWGGVSSWANGNNFTTPIHVYPTPDFTWKPQTIVKDQLVQFCAIKQTGVCDTDNSICYGAGYPSCSGSNFIWSLPPNAEFASSTNSTTPNPVIKFKDSGKNQAVSLQIHDDAGTCSASKNVNVSLPLPKWKEVLPGQ
ncbi:MAG: hypothetical protein PHW31_00710 [Candidatus Pacebacteria bacterium]|nr:hypothetical protein [Candidatus Paceibacterota bacterium]